MGDLVQQNAETAVAYEAEAAQEAEEDGLAEEAAEADAAKKAEEECVAREAAELACKTEKERQARNAAAEQPGGQEQRLALEAAQKAEEEHLNVLSFSARTSQSSKTAAALATVIITEAALEKRLLG